MVKTRIVKLKNEKGEETASVFGDLIEVYQEMQNLQDSAEKSSDYLDAFIMTKNLIRNLIGQTLESENAKKNNKVSEVDP